MEHACLKIEGVELSNMSSTNRIKVLEDFIKLVSLFHSSQVNIYLQSGIYAYKFSYGTFLDLLYLPWTAFTANPIFKGIPQTIYQSLNSVCMAHPALGEEISDDEWLTKIGVKQFYGVVPLTCKDYVKTVDEWQNSRCLYYSANPNNYNWNLLDDEFLPNKQYSDQILRDEIHNAQLDQEYEELKYKNNADPLATVFHDLLMRHKGENLAGYAWKIGEKICLANFYSYEDKLSSTESKLSKSLRKIFSFINRNDDKQYISIDFKHGMFEYYDNKGKHLGEHRFTGQLNSVPDSSHDLKSQLP